MAGRPPSPAGRPLSPGGPPPGGPPGRGPPVGRPVGPPGGGGGPSIQIGIENMGNALRVMVQSGFVGGLTDERKPDPYVVISHAGQKRETRKAKNTIQPYWNEPLQFSPFNPNEPLRIEVFDKDFDRDDLMGAATVPLNGLRPGMTQQNVPLVPARRAGLLGNKREYGAPQQGYGPGYGPGGGYGSRPNARRLPVLPEGWGEYYGPGNQAVIRPLSSDLRYTYEAPARPVSPYGPPPGWGAPPIGGSGGSGPYGPPSVGGPPGRTTPPRNLTPPRYGSPSMANPGGYPPQYMGGYGPGPSGPPAVPSSPRYGHFDDGYGYPSSGHFGYW